MRLPPYKFNVVYKAGADNPTDYLSPHPIEMHAVKQGRMAETYMNFIADSSLPKAMTLVEIEQASNADKEIRAVRACIKLNQWNFDAVRPFKDCRDELTVTSNGVF